MNIFKNIDDKVMNIELEGRLDTNTSPDLEKSIFEDIDDVSEINIDVKNLEYISSAGLRVFLATQKKMNAVEGKLTVYNPSDYLMETFDVTGFSNILTLVRAEEE